MCADVSSLYFYIITVKPLVLLPSLRTAGGTRPPCNQRKKTSRSKRKAVMLPLVLNHRATGVRGRPRDDDHAGGDFFLEPLALSSALETRDALEEAAELAALLLFGLSGISQPDSELARELDGSWAVSSCSGMNHCSATFGSKTPPPSDSVSAHASEVLHMVEIFMPS